MNKKIIRSRDVVFFEDQTLEDAKQEKPIHQTSLVSYGP